MDYTPLQTLRNSPLYRAMSAREQMDVSSRLAAAMIREDVAAATMPYAQQKEAAQKLAVMNATFGDDQGFGSNVRAQVQSLFGGDSATFNGANTNAQMFQNSGILGFVNRVTPLHKLVGTNEDLSRAAEVYKAAAAITGSGEGSGTFGAVIGNLFDIAGVNLATGGVSKLLAKGITTAAAKLAGVTAEAAAAVGRSMPIANRVVNVLAEPFAEALVEAVPYFYLSEERNRAQGLPSIASQGMGEVALTLGKNAALDFAVGTVVTSLLGGIGKVGGQLIRSRKGMQTIVKDADEMAALFDQAAVGVSDPALRQRMSAIEAAQQTTRQNAMRYVRKPADVADLTAKNSWIAHINLQALDNAVDAAGNRIYKVYEFAEDGRPREHIYQNANEMEDYVAFSFTARTNTKVENVLKSNPKLTREDALAQFVRPDTAWAYQRGMTLYNQTSLIGSDLVRQANPELQDLLGTTPKRWQNPAGRPVVSLDEANVIRSTGGPGVVMANVPLDGKIVDAVNSKQLNILRGSGPMKVEISDSPNMLFVGLNEAPLDVYKAATLEADRVMKIDPSRTLEEARASLLMNAGYDHAKLGPNQFEFFSPRNAKLIGTPDDLIIDPNKIGKAVNATTSGVIEESQRVLMRGVSLQANPEVMVAGFKKALTSADPEDMKNFTKAYLGSAGAGSYDVRILHSSPDFVSVKEHDGIIDIVIPKNLKINADSPTLVRKLTEGLNDIAKKGTNAKSLKSGSFYASLLSKKASNFDLGSAADSEAWVRFTSERLGGTFSKNSQGLYDVILPSGGGTFSTVDEAVTFLSRKTTSEPTFINDLAIQGIKVQKLNKQFLARSSSGAILAQDPTAFGLMQKLDYVPSSLNSALGPTDVMLTPGGIEFTWNGTKTFKDTTQGLRFMAKFKDSRILTGAQRLKVSAKGDLSLLADGQYRVFLPRLNITQTFSDLPSARKFLENEKLTMPGLSSVAERKFIDIYRDGNSFVVSAPDKVYRVGTYEEIEEIIKGYPDISESVPDLVKLDPELGSTVEDLVRTYKTNTWGKAGRNKFNQPPEFDLADRYESLGLSLTARRKTSEMYGWWNAAIDKTGFKPLAPRLSQLQIAHRMAETDITRNGVLLENIFADTTRGFGSKRKILDDESCRKIYYHLASGQGPADAAFLKNQSILKYKQDLTAAALTPAEQAAAANLRTWFKDMGAKFNIDYEKLIFNYMPRLREAASQLPQELRDASITGMDLAKHVPEWANGNVPKEIRFFADFERTAEMPQYWLRDNALEVALLYSNQGHKKLYLNGPIQEINRLFKEAGNKIDPTMQLQWDAFRSSIMGRPQSDGEKFISEVGEKLFRGIARGPIGKLFKIKEEAFASVGRNILNNTMSLTYTASMGWKPFLAIRNVFQVDTMAGMRIGLDWVHAGKKAVLDNPEAWYQKLRKSGIINERAPVVNMQFNRNTGFGKIAENGFNWFKNADDYTRAVTYASAELRLQNAITLKKIDPAMTKAKFLLESGLDRFPPELGEEVMTLLAKGRDGIDGAVDAYASHLTRVTMFDYSGSGTPLIHNGFVGRLFGQFGTYSAGFRANIMEALRYGSVAQKATSIATYLAVTGVLWATFEALKIKTNDFVPFGASVFGGGPMFDMAHNMTKALQNDYEGLQARSALVRDSTIFIPGSAQARYVGTFLKALDEGDTYKAFLAIGMVPMTSPKE